MQHPTAHSRLAISGPSVSQNASPLDTAAHERLGINSATRPSFFNMQIETPTPTRRLYRPTSTCSSSEASKRLYEYATSTDELSGSCKHQEVYDHFCHIIRNMNAVTKGWPVSYLDAALNFRDAFEDLQTIQHAITQFGLIATDTSLLRSYIFTATWINFQDIINNTERLEAFLTRFVGFDFASKNKEAIGQFVRYVSSSSNVELRAIRFLPIDTDLNFDAVSRYLTERCCFDFIYQAILNVGVDVDQNSTFLGLDKQKILYRQLIDSRVLFRLSRYNQLLHTACVESSNKHLSDCIVKTTTTMAILNASLFSIPIDADELNTLLFTSDSARVGDINDNHALLLKTLTLFWSINLLDDYHSLLRFDRQRLNNINAKLVDLNIYKIINELREGREEAISTVTAEILENYFECLTGALAKPSIDDMCTLLRQFNNQELTSEGLLRMTADILELLTTKTLGTNPIAGMSKFISNSLDDQARLIKFALMHLEEIEREETLISIRDNLPRLLPALQKARGFINMQSAQSAWGESWIAVTRDIAEVNKRLISPRNF